MQSNLQLIAQEWKSDQCLNRPAALAKPLFPHLRYYLYLAEIKCLSALSPLASQEAGENSGINLALLLLYLT